MSVVKNFKSGEFCWADLSAANVETVKTFYMQLFGWEKIEIPIGEGRTYAMMQYNGRDVCGISEAGPEEKKMGVPPHWNIYIAVDSLETYVKRAESLKAKVILAPRDVFDSGRMAVVQDPTGAVFSMWQANKHQGYGVYNEPNAPCWAELATKDQKHAIAFYTELFGYKTHTNDTAHGPYVELNVDNKGIGGIMQIGSDWGPMPSHWANYFAVNNCDDTCAKVTKLGGSVKFGPTDIPKVGRFASIADPDGAMFYIIAMPK